MPTTDRDMIAVGEATLREAEAMADWLDHHLPDIHKYPSRARRMPRRGSGVAEA
jgi:hypothetical protein